MLCKFYLYTGSSKFKLSSAKDVTNDIKNWEDIKISYTRKDLGGVVRKVSSDVEFVGEAREMILREYEKNYLLSEASFAIYTIDNNWRYELRWSCPLDFATMEDADGVLSMSSIDNSAANVIKSNKSTKYDLTAEGDDIVVDSVPITRFVRVKVSPHSQEPEPGAKNINIQQHLTNYAIARTSHVTCYLPASAVLVNEEGEDIPGGDVGDDYIEVHARDWGIISPDDNMSNDYWLIKAKKACRVYLNMGMLHYEVEASCDSGYEKYIQIEAFGGNSSGGSFTSFVAGEEEVTGNHYQCTINKHTLVEIHGNNGSIGDEYVDMQPGDVFGLAFRINNIDDETEMFGGIGLELYARYHYTDNLGEVIQGTMGYEYIAAGEVNVPSETLDDGLNKLMKEIGGISHVEALGQYGDYRNIIGEIKNDNPTIGITRLLPASYIKDSAIKKLQLSFTNFASMMEACFGYVYDIEMHREMGVRWGHVMYEGQVCRCMHVDIEAESSYTTGYVSWSGWEALDNRMPYYRTEAFGEKYEHSLHLESCTLFCKCKMDDPTKLGWFSSLYANGNGLQYWNASYFIKFKGRFYRCEIRSYTPTMALHDDVREVHTAEDDQYMIEYEKVVFAHRTKLFDTTKVKMLEGVKSLRRTLAEDAVYSEVEIGYDKKDYDSSDLEGKEFNGLATFITGVDLNDRKLTLSCPLRADCMGIEQALRKRTEDKKDDKKEDNDVFIVVCSKDENNQWIIKPNNTITSSGSIETAAVIRNDLLHPVRMVEANKELIGMFARTLKRTAFDGNDNVKVDDAYWNIIDVEARLGRCMKYTIETGDITMPANYNGLIAFKWEGKLYKGFILDVDFKFASEEAATYSLLAYEDD